MYDYECDFVFGVIAFAVVFSVVKVDGYLIEKLWFDMFVSVSLLYS